MGSRCEQALERPLPPPPYVDFERKKRFPPIRGAEGPIVRDATIYGGPVADPPLEVKFPPLSLYIALIGGLVLFRKRKRIQRILGSFQPMRTAEPSPRMPISAKSVVIEPTEDLSEGTSTGLQSQPSSGLRHRNRADHNLVERLGSE